MLKAFINKIKKNKNKILVGVSFIAAAYLFYKSLDDDSSIKFSSFLDVLNNKQLQEVIIKGNTIYFRSAASQWYHTQFDYFFR